ncbi:hypothetical protein BJY52DRAFT_1299643, partial [Lactarius psammicola]
MIKKETPLDRVLQATELARIMPTSHLDPLIFLGAPCSLPAVPRTHIGPFLTTTPYDIAVRDGRVYDINKD